MIHVKRGTLIPAVNHILIFNKPLPFFNPKHYHPNFGAGLMPHHVAHTGSAEDTGGLGTKDLQDTELASLSL